MHALRDGIVLVRVRRIRAVYAGTNVCLDEVHYARTVWAFSCLGLEIKMAEPIWRTEIIKINRFE